MNAAACRLTAAAVQSQRLNMSELLLNNTLKAMVVVALLQLLRLTAALHQHRAYL